MDQRGVQIVKPFFVQLVQTVRIAFGICAVVLESCAAFVQMFLKRAVLADREKCAAVSLAVRDREKILFNRRVGNIVDSSSQRSVLHSPAELQRRAVFGLPAVTLRVIRIAGLVLPYAGLRQLPQIAGIFENHVSAVIFALRTGLSVYKAVFSGKNVRRVDGGRPDLAFGRDPCIVPCCAGGHIQKAGGADG